MASIITRQTGTTGVDGVTRKDAPLTNTEIDTNFINLNNSKVESSDVQTLTNKKIVTDNVSTIFTKPNSESASQSSRTVHNLVEYKSTNTSLTGAIVIIAPNTNTDIIHQLEVQGVVFNSGIIDFEAQGYRNTSTWSSTRLINRGNVAPSSLNWATTPDGKNCIIIGATSSTWNQPQISVTKAMFSGNGISDDYCTGWTVSVVTSLTGYTNLSSLFTNIASMGTSITGNAATATTLQTARTINGTSFNGSANITTANWGTSRTLNIGGASQSYAGGADLTMTRASILSTPSDNSGDIIAYVPQSLASGTFNASSATWDKNNPVVELFGTQSADVTDRLSALTTGNVITVIGSFGSANLTLTGPVTNIGGFPATIPVNNASSTGSTEVVTSITFPTLAGSATWTNIPRNSDTQLTSLGVGTAASGVAGEIRATNDITAFYSDKRLKQDIQTIENALDKIDVLSGVYYTQNKLAEEYGYNNYNRQVGVLAQEVQSVLPEAVKPAPFDIAEDGSSKSGENYLTVQYEKLIPLLIQAIKELKVEIETLKQR